jgi:hypothetical protein
MARQIDGGKGLREARGRTRVGELRESEAREEFRDWHGVENSVYIIPFDHAPQLYLQLPPVFQGGILGFRPRVSFAGHRSIDT